MKAIHVFRILILGIVTLSLSMCKEVDSIPPVITLLGPDSLEHILNEPYIDQGAKAMDETEGDITSKLFVKVNVNENKVGDYLVDYRVVDESGNEAIPVSRFVRVVNTSRKYTGHYEVSENEIFPGQSACSYTTFIRIDSTVNNRMIIERFGCDTIFPCFINISEPIVILPFQVFESDTNAFTLQGSGWLNDTVVSIEYSSKSAGETIYKNAVFTR